MANEPELIRWVHLVEVTSFLAAYQHLAKQPLSAQACDQYITEMARVGHMLGAVDLPLTYADTQAELLAYAMLCALMRAPKKFCKSFRPIPSTCWTSLGWPWF